MRAKGQPWPPGSRPALPGHALCVCACFCVVPSLNYHGNPIRSETSVREKRGNFHNRRGSWLQHWSFSVFPPAVPFSNKCWQENTAQVQVRSVQEPCQFTQATEYKDYYTVTFEMMSLGCWYRRRNKILRFKNMLLMWGSPPSRANVIVRKLSRAPVGCAYNWEKIECMRIIISYTYVYVYIYICICVYVYHMHTHIYTFIMVYVGILYIIRIHHNCSKQNFDVLFDGFVFAILWGGLGVILGGCLGRMLKHVWEVFEYIFLQLWSRLLQVKNQYETLTHLIQTY